MTRSSAEVVLLDTSVSLPYLVQDHEAHDAVSQRLVDLRVGLSGHAAFETFSVLTRLPAALRVTPEAAASLLQQAFPETVALPVAEATEVLAELGRHGIAGGKVYDALVGVAARSAGHLLLSRDRRAWETYLLLGVNVELLD